MLLLWAQHASQSDVQNLKSVILTSTKASDRQRTVHLSKMINSEDRVFDFV
jgi:hypothetical protein